MSPLHGKLNCRSHCILIASLLLVSHNAAIQLFSINHHRFGFIVLHALDSALEGCRRGNLCKLSTTAEHLESNLCGRLSQQ